MHADKSDEQLMLAFKAGDESGFEVLLLRHKKALYNFIFRFVGNPSDAEELFQEVFLKIYRNVADYEPIGKFKTWLFTIARNLCVDHYRKGKIRKYQLLSEPVGSSGELTKLDMLESADPSPEQDTNLARLEEVLSSALATLNEDQRGVFLLREKMGFKFEEIAAMTHVSVNTVKSRMRYALEGIRKAILASRFSELLDQFEEKHE